MGEAAGHADLGAPLLLGGETDPYPLFAAARRRGPVQHVSPFGPADGPPSAHVLTYDEVVTVLRDHERFSSALLGEAMGPMFAGTLVTLDEPGHRVHRALVAPALRPKLLAAWQAPVIRAVVDELIDRFAGRGRADLVAELTLAFPARVIAGILGLPQADVVRFQSWADDLIGIFADWERGMAALEEFGDYALDLIASRRRHPGDDLVSALVSAEVDGRGLDDEEVFSFLRLLLPAGIETTYRSLGNLLVALLTHPEQLAAVRADPDRRSPAVEEGLRWETPFLFVIRLATRDTELAGVRIPAGQVVCAYVASANHDESRFAHPEAFDLARPPAPHVAFGAGPHVCLGMHLARLESRIALDALLERLPGLRADPDRPPPRVSGALVFRSPEAISVRFG
jgi:cytochrome P450